MPGPQILTGIRAGICSELNRREQRTPGRKDSGNQTGMLDPFVMRYLEPGEFRWMDWSAGIFLCQLLRGSAGKADGKLTPELIAKRLESRRYTMNQSWLPIHDKTQTQKKGEA